MSERLDEICTIELPSGESTGVFRRRFSGAPGPTVAIVAGIRGDTPEGTRIAHGVGAFLRENHERLVGTVDIYPCVNPLAAHHGARAWPAFDVDLNRRFPGKAEGHAPDAVARALFDALSGSLQVIELRGAHPAFREETQAHVRADNPTALERAMHANVRVVWRRGEGNAPGTLANEIPGMICLEGGVGNRLTPNVGLELTDGVLNLLVTLGVLPEDGMPFHWAAIQRPRVATDNDVIRVRATRAGLFLPYGRMWTEVQEGDPLGEVVDPIGGDTREIVAAPQAGNVLALREQPVVYPGSLVARLLVTA